MRECDLNFCASVRYNKTGCGSRRAIAFLRRTRRFSHASQDCPIFSTDNKSFNSGCHFLTRDGTRRQLVPQTRVPRADAVASQPNRARKPAVIQRWRVMRATERCPSRRRKSETSSRRRWIAFVGSTSATRSEEHTSELQSRLHLVCRLLLEKTKLHSFIASMMQKLQLSDITN